MSQVSICMLTLASVLLTASADEVELKILPKEAHFLVNKWSVNFTCTLSSTGRNDSEITSANLTFFVLIGNTDSTVQIPDSCTTVINSTTLELNQCEHVEAYAISVWFRCRLKHNQSVKSKGSSKVNVRLEHPQPEIPVSEAEVYNWADLTFLVYTGENKTWMYPVDYAAWVRNDSDNSDYQRIHTEELNGGFLKATVKDPFGFLTDDLIVKVNGSASEKKEPKRIIETISSQEVQLNLNQLVKPARVESIRTHQNDSSKLTVSFEAPRLNRNITYGIVVECNKTPNKYTANITRRVEGLDLDEAQVLGYRQQYRVDTAFTTLPPASICTAFVRAISTAGGKWSDWNSHTFETVEGVPLRNPDVCSSCFSVQRDVSKSTLDVIIYFVPLSDETAQGKVVVYRIRVFEKVDPLEKEASHESSHYLNNTEVNHLSFHLRNLSIVVDYQIGIEAGTSRGYNLSLEKSNQIRFSPRDVVSFRSHVTHFAVILLNKTAARIDWKINEDGCSAGKKTFLFLCKGNSQTKTCSEVLKWKSVSSDSRSEVIVFTDDESIFGIGFECNGISSGILWNTCIFEINAKPSDPRVESIKTSESSATILLNDTSEECPPSGRGRGLTVSYRLSYCRILRNGSGSDGKCLDAATTLVHSRSPGVGTLVILDGMNDDQTYRLSIQSVSETNMSSGTVTKIFSTKYREPIGALLVSFVVAGVLFVVLIIVLLTGCRIYVVSGQYDIPVVVKSPVRKVTAANFTGSESYDEYGVAQCNGDVSPESCYEDLGVIERTSLPGPDGEQRVLGLGFSEAKGAEHGKSLQPGVAPVSSDPVNHRYCSVRPESVSSFPVPVLISDSLHVQRFPFEEDDTNKSSPRILTMVGGSVEDLLQKTESRHQEQIKDSTSVSECSSFSSGNQDYHQCTTVKSSVIAETEKSVAAVAAADAAADAACDSGSGYVDGLARVVTVIQPPPSEPPQSFMRDHGHGRNSMFADLYRSSVSSDVGGDDDGGGGGSSSGTTDYLEELNPSDFHGDSESQVQSKTSSEADGISLIDSSLEQLNSEKMEIHFDVHPDGDRVLDPIEPLIPVLPVCAPATASCSGSQQFSSGSGSSTPSSCDATNLGLASDEEDSETALSCLDESIEYRSDQLFTRPVDSELRLFTSESILPPILSA